MAKCAWIQRGRNEGPVRDVYSRCEPYFWRRTGARSSLFHQEHGRWRQLDNPQSHRDGHHEWHHGCLFQRSIEWICRGHGPTQFFRRLFDALLWPNCQNNRWRRYVDTGPNNNCFVRLLLENVLADAADWLRFTSTKRFLF